MGDVIIMNDEQLKCLVTTIGERSMVKAKLPGVFRNLC